MTAIVDQILDAVFANQLADLTLAGLTHSYDARDLTANAAAPRIVVYPTTGRFGPTTAPGGRLLNTGGQAATPRTLRTLYQTLEAHCWGADRAGAETLLHRLVRGFYLEAHQSWEPTSLQWATQMDRPAYLKAGELVVITFEVQIPVTDAMSTIVKAIALPFDQTGASPTDGVLQAGES